MCVLGMSIRGQRFEFAYKDAHAGSCEGVRRLVGGLNAMVGTFHHVRFANGGVLSCDAATEHVTQLT